MSGVKVDLREDGVLWLINASVFHPRGFALAVDEEGQFWLLGNGSEPWVFTDGAGDAPFAAVGRLLDMARELNTDQVPLPVLHVDPPMPCEIGWCSKKATGRVAAGWRCDDHLPVRPWTEAT